MLGAFAPVKAGEQSSMFVQSADDISILKTVFSPFKIEEDLEIVISLVEKYQLHFL